MGNRQANQIEAVDSRLESMVDPPVVESLVELRSGPIEVNSEANRRFIEELARANGLELHSASAMAAGDTEPNSIELVSPDKKEAFVMSQSGLVFSRLAPHLGWEQFISSAWKYIGAYLEFAPAAAINQLALRVVNWLPSPPGPNGLAGVLAQPPRSHQSLGASLNDYIVAENLSLAVGNVPFSVQVVQAHQAEKSDGSEERGIILDISVIRENPKDTAPENLRACLDMMRQIKNQVFAAYVSPDFVRERTKS